MTQVQGTESAMGFRATLSLCGSWAILGCLLGWSATVVACPFCSPNVTLTERIDQAHECYVVEWVDAQAGDADQREPGTTRVRIVDVYKTAAPARRIGDVVTLSHFSPGEIGSVSLLFGHLGEGEILLWDGLKSCSAELRTYLSNRPGVEIQSPARLPYFIPYLEHSDEEIAVDAYSEFANASFDDVRSLASQLPKEDLLRWVSEPAEGTGRFVRVGFYGMVIGLCGGDGEAAALERILLAPSTDLRIGIEGLMAGYLLLRGEAGLDVLMQHVRSPSTSSSEVFALQQATQFIGEYAQSRISRPALCRALHPLVDDPQFAELVLVDLARWEDLSLVNVLVDRYGHPDFSNQPTQTAIVRYYLAMSELPTEGRTNEERELIRKAGEHLESLRQRDPELVAHAGRFLRQMPSNQAVETNLQPPVLAVNHSGLANRDSDDAASRQGWGGQLAMAAACIFAIGVLVRRLWRTRTSGNRVV